MPLATTNTAVTTVGNGTLLAAALLGGIITRSGPVGAFTDTTDTAANIAAALTGMGNVVGAITRQTNYLNTTASVATLAAGTGVTLTAGAGAGLTVAAGVMAELLISVTPSSGAVTVTVLARIATQ